MSDTDTAEPITAASTEDEPPTEDADVVEHAHN